MGFHDGIFLIGKLSRFFEYGIRYSYLAYIMQKRHLPEIFALGIAVAYLLRYLHRVLGNPGGMLTCVLILGIDGTRYGKDRLVAHAHLIFYSLDLGLLEIKCSLDEHTCHEPAEPYQKGCHTEHEIDPEPPVILDVHLLFDLVRSLLYGILFFGIQHRYVKNIIPRLKVCI